MTRLRACVAIAGIIGVGALADGLPAQACGCGPVAKTLVAKGSSPRGLPWRIHADRDGPHAVDIDFGFPAPGYTDIGYGTQLPYPLPRFDLMADAGSDLGPAREQDVSGIAARRVVRGVVTLRDGSIVRFRPRPALRAAVRRHPWLRQLRFFDVFFPKSAAPPVRVSAFDAHGHRLHRVSFLR